MDDSKNNIPATSLDVDIEQLLIPISQEAPSGEDLRYDGVVDQIKEARRADDQLEQGEWRTDVKTSDWRQVANLCSEALCSRSKDLQVAIWLLEAWVHLYGFVGLHAGLDLIRRLMQSFWPTLYPSMENGDAEYRIRPLMLLNEKLPPVVLQVPLCDPELTKGYGYYQWEESQVVGSGQNLDKEQKKRREALIGEGKISAEMFSTATNATPLTYYRNLTRQLVQARESLGTLDEISSEFFAPDPPGFSQLMEAIDACTWVADRIFKDKCKSEVLPEDMEPAPEVKPVGGAEVSPPTDEAQPAVKSDPGSLLGTHEIQPRAIGDISPDESGLWQRAVQKLGQGRLKEAMDQMLSAAALAPSTREKNRYLLLLAKLCLKAERVDLARPIAEELHNKVETLNLGQWEHPCWIAEVVETLYRCLAAVDEGGTDRARELFQKLCLLNVTKAAAYRL